MRHNERKTQEKIPAIPSFRSNRSRLGVVAGAILVSGLGASALINNCNTPADEEAPVEAIDRKSASRPIHKPNQERIPRSLGCSAEPIENDPIKLQYQYSHRLAQCVEESASDAGTEVVCNVHEGIAAGSELSRDDEQIVSCLAYDEDGYPSNQQSSYIGPVCHEWNDSQVRIQRCLSEGYLSLTTGTILKAPFLTLEENLSNSNDSFHAFSLLNFLVGSTGEKVSDLEDDIPALCEETTARLLESNEFTEIGEKKSREYERASTILSEAGLALEPPEDQRFFENHPDNFSHWQFANGKNALGDEIGCTFTFHTDHPDNIYGVETTTLSCHMCIPFNPQIEAVRNGTLNPCSAFFDRTIESLEYDPSVLEEMANCDPYQ